MARLARVVVPGIPHHITQRGNHRLIADSFADFPGRLAVVGVWRTRIGSEGKTKRIVHTNWIEHFVKSLWPSIRAGAIPQGFYGGQGHGNESEMEWLRHLPASGRHHHLGAKFRGHHT